MSVPCLCLERVSKSFRGELVVSGISLSVRGGEIHGIVGPNGAGKTTLVRIAAGLIPPDEGVVRREGSLGYVPQDNLLLPWMRLWENIGFGLLLRGRKREEVRREVEKLAPGLGLTEHLDKYPRHVSGGTARKAAIARALVLDPDIVLMDEPYTGLDPASLEALQATIRGLKRRGKAVVIVSHQVAELVEVADIVHVVSGRPARITASIEVEEDIDEAIIRVLTASRRSPSQG